MGNKLAMEWKRMRIVALESVLRGRGRGFDHMPPPPAGGPHMAWQRPRA
jgi:hypothetical protein